MKLSPIQEKLMKQRLIASLELMELGVLLMRQNIRRKLPNAASEVIESELRRWLIDQPADFVARDSSNQ